MPALSKRSASKGLAPKPALGGFHIFDFCILIFEFFFASAPDFLYHCF
jgi:hypothetical protein